MPSPRHTLAQGCLQSPQASSKSAHQRHVQILRSHFAIFAAALRARAAHKHCLSIAATIAHSRKRGSVISSNAHRHLRTLFLPPTSTCPAHADLGSCTCTTSAATHLVANSDGHAFAFSVREHDARPQKEFDGALKAEDGLLQRQRRSRLLINTTGCKHASSAPQTCRAAALACRCIRCT